nr:hypothetical protein Iba_chr15aCG10690 [Ipomoea batatas]
MLRREEEHPETEEGDAAAVTNPHHNLAPPYCLGEGEGDALLLVRELLPAYSPGKVSLDYRESREGDGRKENCGREQRIPFCIASSFAGEGETKTAGRRGYRTEIVGSSTVHSVLLPGVVARREREQGDRGLRSLAERGRMAETSRPPRGEGRHKRFTVAVLPSSEENGDTGSRHCCCLGAFLNAAHLHSPPLTPSEKGAPPKPHRCHKPSLDSSFFRRRGRRMKVQACRRWRFVASLPRDE